MRVPQNARAGCAQNVAAHTGTDRSVTYDLLLVIGGIRASIPISGLGLGDRVRPGLNAATASL